MTDQFKDGRGKPQPGDKKDESEYEVGYCKPPRNTRFKKGQSGNPKGRPKHKSEFECQRDMRAIFMRAAMTPISTRVKGRQTRMPALEAMYLKLFARAIEGDGPSMRFVHTVARELVAEHEEWQVTFFEQAQGLLEDLECQPEDKKDRGTIKLLEESINRVNAKITDEF